jgi:hypothetical protein
LEFCIEGTIERFYIELEAFKAADFMLRGIGLCASEEANEVGRQTVSLNGRIAVIG